MMQGVGCLLSVPMSRTSSSLFIWSSSSTPMVLGVSRQAGGTARMAGPAPSECFVATHLTGFPSGWEEAAV